MKAEHLDVDDQLATLKILTNAFTAPTDACSSWRALYRGCLKIHQDLGQHMRLENGELFTRFVR